jgi:acetyltransferase-like isoleucine patch superfamily enzyme
LNARLEHDWFPRALPDNVVIGPRSWCYSSFAFMHYQSRQPCGVRIGSDSGIYNGTFFDVGPQGQVIIGNYCTLVGAIIATNGQVEIGDYAFLAHEVVLADHAVMMPGLSAVSPDHSSLKSIVIGSNCWIGARAILLAGASIGEGAIVGAGAVVNGTVPPFTIAAGNPARQVASLPH